MIYAISDLHLPGKQDKAMDVFGAHWQDHAQRIQNDALLRMTPDDLLLIPGDISWAMTLDEAQPDLDYIGNLPGQKVILRGNHDYWWASLSRLRSALPASVYALQNDAYVYGDYVICGTRGWICDEDLCISDQDRKIYLRELQRLELSLKEARRLANGRRLIGMQHYPPFSDLPAPTGFTQLWEKYAVDDVVYGHLHGARLRTAFHGRYNGVFYHQTSCDRLGFELYPLFG